MQVAMVAVAVVAMLEMAQGHLCMISPHQRGSMKGINKPKALDCQLTKAPCGGRVNQAPTISFNADQTFLMTVQKNVNHFNAKNPGSITVSIGPSSANLQLLESIKDTSAPALTLYSFNITVPSGLVGNMVLQAVYHTNNPKAPPAFYQCADVNIFP